MTTMQGLTNQETVEFEPLWKVLEVALREIHSKNASQLSFEVLYRTSYKLVLKKKGEDLYNKVSDLEQELLRQNVRTQVVHTVTPPLMLGATGGQIGGQAHQRRADGERFLKVLKDAYADHQLCMNMITDVLMYMVSFVESPSIADMTCLVHSTLIRIASTAQTSAALRSMPQRWLFSGRKCLVL